MVKEFNELIGKTITKIESVYDYYSDNRKDGVERGAQQIIFTMDDGTVLIISHDQFGGEDVNVEDIIGDIQCLIGSPLTQAEVVHEENKENYCAWSFCKFATVKGYVTIRWYGESNGYYSVDVSYHYYDKNRTLLLEWSPDIEDNKLRFGSDE